MSDSMLGLGRCGCAPRLRLKLALKLLVLFDKLCILFDLFVDVVE
jgi:hypothetical protein